MAFQPYEFLFTDQNLNREFVVQPYTTNGPSAPDGGVDPSAANANTTLFLYGKGSPNYGDRIQENLIFMMEHFFSVTEPSFPIPGQIWCRSSTNELTTPFQMFMFNPRKFVITASGTNQIYVISDDGSLSQTQTLQRFQNLGLAKQFTVYDNVYNQLVFVQSALPIISGPSNVLLTVTPAVPGSGLVGQYIGGWEEIYQGNTQVVLRRSFNANFNNLINLAVPVNPGDATNKAYVDSAITGGSISLGSLSDVHYQTVGHPQTGAFLEFNGTNWTDVLLGTLFLSLSGGTMIGSINMSGNSITNVAVPVGAFDAVNKVYVDQQPLSSVRVSIISPVTGNVLYFTSGGIWHNADPATAGLVPLTGGVTITGALSVLGGITGLPAPINPADAANKAYVDATVGGGGIITSGTFNNFNGILTLTPSSGPNIIITGWLPTPNNQVSSLLVGFTPQNPNSNPTNTANNFFANTLGDGTYTNPNNTEDPINITLQAVLNQIDLALGNFTVPRQRFVFPTNGTRKQFDINKGAGLSPIIPPNGKYVKGSSNLEIFLNGVKQVASTSAVARITNFTVGATYGSVTFDTLHVIIPGNVTRIFHTGVQFTTTGTNAGSYYVSSPPIFSGGNTNIPVQPNNYSSTPGPFPLTIGSGSATYTVNELTGDMETGYIFSGIASSAKTLGVTVNGLTPVTVSIDPTLNNCSSMALLCDKINQQALSFYCNPIVNIIGLNFFVNGNVAAQFPTGKQFVIRYATNNGPSDTGTNYTVTAPGAVFSTGQTAIPVAAIPNVTPVDGVIFQDPWGFTCGIENGLLTFHSNIPGASSAIVVSDPGVGGLLTGITGITWPITFTNPTVTSGNVFAPTDYGYKEVGLFGYQSSLFYFNIAPANTDTMEIIIDREIIYNSTNPFVVATIA